MSGEGRWKDKEKAEVLGMSDISEKQIDKYLYNNWGIRINAMEIGLQTGNPFPNQDGFNGSIWWVWKNRIENGHNEEKEQIDRMYKKWKKQIGHSDDPSFNPDEWVGDDYWETCRLTNSMYAALVVSIWSETERFLKSIISICFEADGKLKKNKEPYQFRVGNRGRT